MEMAMAPFDKSHTSSYWRTTATVALYCIVTDILNGVPLSSTVRSLMSKT